jgi:hypothetical protein
MSNKGLSRRLPRVYAVFLALGGLFFSVTSYLWTLQAAHLLRPEDGRLANFLLATGWQVLSICCASVGWYLVKNGEEPPTRLRGWALIGSAVFLLCGSIGASFATISHDVAQSEKDRLTSSREYQSKSDNLDSIDEDIAKAKELEDIYKGQNDPQSALATSRHINALRDKRNAAEANLASLEAKSGFGAASSPADVALGILTGSGNLNAKSLAYFFLQLFIAVVVDVAGLSALSISIEGLLSSLNSSRNQDETNVTRLDFETKRRGVGGPRGDTGVREKGINNRYEQAKQLILSKTVEEPEFRPMEKIMRASTPVVKRWYDGMVEEGILLWNGKNYERVSAAA